MYCSQSTMEKAKDYGIMALRGRKSTLWDLFRFLLFSRFDCIFYLLSFSGFLLEKIMRSASEAGCYRKLIGGRYTKKIVSFNS